MTNAAKALDTGVPYESRDVAPHADVVDEYVSGAEARGPESSSRGRRAAHMPG